MKKTKKLILKYFYLWQLRLGLKWWVIDLCFHRDPATIIERFSNPGDGEGVTLAMTTVRWQYLTATIEFNLPSWKGLSEKSIEHHILHELCHILVNEMREGEIHHEERVVTGLTDAFLWTEENIKDVANKE